MAHKKRLQEISDPGKLWIAKGIGRSLQGDDPLCRNCTTQGTRDSETRRRRYGTENLEGTDVQDEIMEERKLCSVSAVTSQWIVIT
jgi:hypothetical protein